MTTTKLPPITESGFMEQITDLATLLGWEWCHWRAARTMRGWTTATSGPLGKGLPDLFLCRVRDQRAMWIEVKRQGGRLSGDQQRVIDALRDAGQTALVWQPSDWDTILEVLKP